MLRKLFLLLPCILGAFSAHLNHNLQFNAKDSAIIIDTGKPLPPKIGTLPYYQPIQHQPSYKILNNNRQQTQQEQLNQKASTPNAADVFTQEEFPRDLLEIAQKKLGLKTLDEVPTITELAELLGTNSAAETISYIRQLTSTEQGIALMKAYIESSDYTDNVGETEQQTTTPKVTTTTTPTAATTNVSAQPTFFERMASYFNIYQVQPQHKQAMQQQFQKVISTAPKFQFNNMHNMRPMYVRKSLPYHHPIPLRPLNGNNRPYNPIMYRPTVNLTMPAATSHLNTAKNLSPGHIQQLARVANIPPKKLELFLEQKPKLAEVAAKFVRFPSAQERNPMADRQLLAAVQKVMEQDEDLKKLLNSANTLK